MTRTFDFSRALMGSALVVVVGCFGCASGVTSPSETNPGEFAGAPSWVVSGCTTLDDPTQICGVGAMGGTRNISLARTTAVARGRVELARTLQVKVKAMLKDYQATTTGGEQFREASSDEQHVLDVSKQITDTALTGTEMRELWVSQNGTLYALVVLDVEKFRASLKQMEDLDEEVRRAIDERARAAFEDLDRHASRH